MLVYLWGASNVKLLFNSTKSYPPCCKHGSWAFVKHVRNTVVLHAKCWAGLVDAGLKNRLSILLNKSWLSHTTAPAPPSKSEVLTPPTHSWLVVAADCHYLIDS